METNKINNSTVKPTRRKFLTRTAAGVVVASIPARSVLANNIVNSIVASGNASDFSGGEPIELIGPCKWLELEDYWTNVNDSSFLSIFGEGPSTSLNSLLECFCCMKPFSIGDDDNDDNDDQGQCASGDDDGGGNINTPFALMIAMYLNAIVDFNHKGNTPYGLHYPIITKVGDLDIYIESLRQNRFNLAAIIEQHGGDAQPSQTCLITNNNSDDDSD